jgi:pimeloyl-ACP methyl ester carboxylesterase
LVDAKRIALVGHSEGSTVAPLVAADQELAGVVLMAGLGSPGVNTLIHQARGFITSASLEIERLSKHPEPGGADFIKFLKGEIQKAHDRISALESFAAGRAMSPSQSSLFNAWEHGMMSFDPSQVARRVSEPALILHGTGDRQVAPVEAARLAHALGLGGNQDVEVELFDGLGHDFVPPPKSLSELSDDQTERLDAMSEEVFARVEGWLVQHLMSSVEIGFPPGR